MINDQLKKRMQESQQKVASLAPAQKRQTFTAAKTAAQTMTGAKKQTSSAYQRASAIGSGQKKNTGWQYRADGTRKSFNELSNAEVLAWIGTLPEEERGGAARDFETNYLKNPGSTRYDPYYTDYSNNDAARSMFGVNTFDQEWIDANRGYANYLTFSGENYTTPKKPGKNASEEEKRAYEWWQIANTYEATTQAAESEYAQLRSEIQEMAQISRKAGDRLTADEILEGIDWSDYKTLENLREASAAGNGRYLNRPVQVGDASLRSMIDAALRGEDVTEARDFVYDESEYLKNGQASSKYLLPMEETQPAAQTPAKSYSPYADSTNAKYDPYYGEGSNNQAARELFGVDSFDQDWIDANRGLMAYVKFKDEDDTEPIKPGEDASEQEKAAYEYWKIANTYEETTRKAENELSALQGWMEKQAEKLGEEATADAILDRIDWEDKDWQDEYPTLYNMREVAAAGNARMVNRQVGAGDESLRGMAESILGGAGKNVDVNEAKETSKTASELFEENRKNYGEERAVQMLEQTIGFLNDLDAQGKLTAKQKEQRDEWQAVADAQEKPAAAETTEQPEVPKTASELVDESRSEYGTTGAANQLKVTINYLNGLEAQGMLTDELKAKRDEWQAEYDKLMDDVAERQEIEERVEAEAREESVNKVVAPLRFLWNRGWTDALRDGEFVPTEDYEEFLRYRSNPAAAENAEEMAKYDRYSAAGERTSLMAEGVATGLDKAATATTGGLEYVMYTLARWNPANKGLTKEEIYASDRALAALKGWNEQFDKEYINEETKAELAERYPVVSMVSAGVSEMIKMAGQAGGALPFDPTGMAGAATQYGLSALQNGGAALDLQMFGTPLTKWEKAVQTLGRLGEKAVNTMPFALDVYGSTYETAISEGATEDQAAAAAALNGLFTGSLSSAITSRLTKLGGNITRLFQSRAGQKAAEQGAIMVAKSGTLNAILSVGKQLLESAVEEGFEEAIEEPIQSGISKLVYDRGRAWTGEGGVFDAKAMLESGIGGAVAGSMFTITAGASGMMGKPAKTAADQIVEKAENGEEISQSEIDQLEKIEAREAAIQDKTEDIMAADTSAIDAARAKTDAAAEAARKAEGELQEAEAGKQEAEQQTQPLMNGLNQGTSSYEDPEIRKAIDEAHTQLMNAQNQVDEKTAALDEAKRQHAEMVQAQQETETQAQEAARAQAAAEVDAELQQEKEAEAQAAAEAAQKAAEEPETPGLKWLAKTDKQALTVDQRRQMQILDALGKEYGIEIDITDTVGPGKNGMYAGGRRITVALDATESAYVQVGVHEMVHYVRSMDSDAYSILEEVVLSHLNAGAYEEEEGEILGDLVRQRIEQYEGAQELTEEQAREEIVAELVPQILTNEESTRVLVENNRTLAQKIRDFFIDFAAKLKSIAERYAVANDRGEIYLINENTEALIEIADTLDMALTLAGRAEKRFENESSTGIKLQNKIKYSVSDGHVISGYLESVDQKVLEAAQRYREDKDATFERFILGDVQEREAAEIKKLVGVDVGDYRHAINKNAFVHIENRHGVNGEADNSMADLNDVARIGWILNNYDTVELLLDEKGEQVYSQEFQTAGGKNAPMIEYRKKINGTYYVVEAVSEGKYKKIWVVSAYIGNKKADVTQAPNASNETPRHTSETTLASLSADSSISDSSGNVNGKYSLKSGDDNAQLIGDVKAEEKAEALDDAARIAHKTAKDFKSTIERSEISDGIDRMIDAYQDHDEAAAVAIADELARKILDKSRKTSTDHREGYEDARKRLRETGFSLTDTQKQEVANRLGSYNDWRKSVMGSVKVKNDAASLDAIWSQLSGMHPEYFPADANEAQMPEYIEQFVQAMRPRYENPYGMNMTEAAADLSTRLQADVLDTLGGDSTARAAQLRNDSETYREQKRLETEDKRARQREKRAGQFKEIAGRIKTAREAGNDAAIQQALTDYRKLIGGRSHAADAIDAGIESRNLRREIRRITGIIDNLSDMIAGEDVDFDRSKLIKQRESYEELREQLMRQADALHRQEVLDRAAIPDDEIDQEMETLLAGEMQKQLDGDMSDRIESLVPEVRKRVEGLRTRMKDKMKGDFNMTSTIGREDLTEVFKDLEGEIVKHSELAKLWKRRAVSYQAQLLDETNELSYLKKELRKAKTKGDQTATGTLQGLILDAEDRVDILESQIKHAKAQEQYSRRIGAESLDKALSEGRLPEPIMERVIALCKDAGRRGRFNQNMLVQAAEALRLNSTTAARVYDDLFGDAAPLMRAIYYDPVMDNETDRQRWIKQWRDRISALELTKEQSALVQEIGEGRLNPQDDRYQQADQKVHEAVKVFREFYDEAHALATKALERNGYERPGKITDYFPHIETQKTWWDKLGIPVENTSLPTSINGLTDTFTPGKQYSGHLEHRYGEKTDYDALYGFEQYIGGMSNVIFHTDDIQRHRQLENEIRTTAKRGEFGGGSRSEHLSEFVKWIHEYTNLLAGKKAWMDRPFEGTAGRTIYAAATRLKSIKGASAVCGNLASAVTNMVPVTQVLAEMPVSTLKGAIQMCMGVSNGRGNVPESQYKIRKLGSDSVVQTLYTRFAHYASKPFELVDLFATNVVVNAYYQDNLRMGMDSETAMRSADNKAARLMGDRSKGAMPNIYGSQIAGFFTQFQLEVANQSQHFRKDVLRGGSWKKAMYTMLASAFTGFLWNEFNEWLTGRRPAADPFRMGIDIYNAWKNDGSPMEIGQTAYNSLSEMMPYSSMGGRAAAFDGIGTFIEALTTEGNDGGDVWYAFKQLGYGMVPGGGQLKKIVTGTQAVLEGGYYNAGGTQLRYAVPDFSEDPMTALQAIMFGPSSTKAARDYYAGDAPGLTKTQTEAFEQARARGATSTEAYENEVAKAAAAKLESDVSKTENAILDAEAQARAGEDAPEIDSSRIDEQKANAEQLRSEAMPGDELTDFWWERRNEPQVQAGIEIWRKTGETWALPHAYTKDKSYTIDGRKEYLGSELLKEAEEMYEEGYMEIMQGVDPGKLDEEGYEELQEMLEDLKAEVNAEMKKRIRQRNKELE